MTFIVITKRFLPRSYSAALPHTPLLKHFRGDMYETGNQKDRDRKCITLRDPRGQRYWDEARSVAERTECTGCRYRICCAVPCYRTGCRTRGINLNIVSKCTQRPAGRCCFYRRFVCFNMIFLHSVNDSLVYQPTKQSSKVIPRRCSVCKTASSI